jgi:hypothetical protein
VPILVILPLKIIDVNVVLFCSAVLPSEVIATPFTVAGILRIGGNVPDDAVIDPDETVKVYLYIFEDVDHPAVVALACHVAVAGMIKYAVLGIPVNIVVPVRVGAVVFSITSSIIELHPLKAFAPIVLIPDGMVINVKLLHPWNALVLIVVRVEGIENVVKLEQF